MGGKMKEHTAEELKAMSMKELTTYFDELHKSHQKTY